MFIHLLIMTLPAFSGLQDHQRVVVSDALHLPSPRDDLRGRSYIIFEFFLVHNS